MALESMQLYGNIPDATLLNELEGLSNIDYHLSRSGKLWVSKTAYAQVVSLSILLSLKAKNGLSDEELLFEEILRLPLSKDKFVTISKSTNSIYYYAYLRNVIYALRISDHQSTSFVNSSYIGNKYIGLKILSKEEPITKNTKVLEERYGRKGLVLSSNEFLTVVVYGADLEKYVTNYIKRRVIY